MRNRQHLARPAGDGGAVAILVALLSVFLFGMLGFAVDLGNAYATQRRLSTAADGAALAAAQELALIRTAATDTSCSNLGVPDPLASAAATQVAEQYNRANADVNANYVPLQSGDVVMSCTSGGEGTVEVRNREPVTFTFGRLLGVNGLTPPGDATARYGAASSLSGLRPMGLCSQSLQFSALLNLPPGSPPFTTQVLPPFTTQRFPFEKTFGEKAGPCGSAPGNWGTIDLNNGPPSATDKQLWIQNGYNKELKYLGHSQLLGDPGTLGGGAFDTQLASITPKNILLPVYDSAILDGSRARFNIIGFVSVIFCGWRLGEKVGSSACSLPDTQGTDYFDLQLVRTISVGDFCPKPANCVSAGVSVIALIK